MQKPMANPILYCALFWWLSWPAAGVGQEASDVAFRFLQALAEERWAEAAALVHPETAAFLRAATLPRYECPPEERFPTLEEYRAGRPGMPADEAERSWEEHRHAWDERDEREPIRRRFPGTHDLAELRALPPGEYVARFLAGGSRLGGGEGPRAYHPVVVVGEVQEGEWVNVLYRHAFELEEADPSGEVGFYRPGPRILRLRPDDDGRPRVAWVHGTDAGGRGLGPGMLPSSRPATCPGEG